MAQNKAIFSLGCKKYSMNLGVYLNIHVDVAVTPLLSHLISLLNQETRGSTGIDLVTSGA